MPRSAGPAAAVRGCDTPGREARRCALPPPTSMFPEPVKVLDVVELEVATGRWPKGTQGTVLERFGSEAALVEIADDRGHTLDELELPVEVLRTVSRPSRRRLPAR